MLTYGIADLHGRYDLMMRAFAAIHAHADARPYKVVMLGDYVDRGPDSAKILQHLIDAQESGRGIVCLKGNHEEIMRQTCQGEVSNPHWWIKNGGESTLESYGQKPKAALDFSIVPDEHLKWIESLRLIYTDKHRVFVHAGVDKRYPLEAQERLHIGQHEQIVLWMLYSGDDEGGHGTRHVVHGHHALEDGPLLMKGRTNLDTGAVYTGRLVIGVFQDDVPGGPVDLIEVIGPPA